MRIIVVSDKSGKTLGEARNLHDDLVPFLIQDLGVVGPIWPEWKVPASQPMRYYDHASPEPFFMSWYDEPTGDSEDLLSIELAQINWHLKKVGAWEQMF